MLIPPKEFTRMQGWAKPGITALRNTKHKPDGYSLTATSKGIEITASDDAGEFYAYQTLRELKAINGGRVPACHIHDWPDFPRRGVYLDCARGKAPTVATLKALVERLASWKINELQLYIKNGFTWKQHPEIGRGFSPYTPADLRAVDAHCKAHHIRFVPSLASFSHMELTLALPRYRHLAELPGAMGWPGGTLACMSDPASVKLLAELYDEFLPVFSAHDVNVCCDEPWELGQGRSKSRVAKVGKGRVYLDALLKLNRICQRHGKRMNAWGDIILQHPEVLKDIPKDIVMLNWDYEPEGKLIPRTAEFTAAGVPVMVCPGTGSWQSHGTRMVKSMANVANFAAAGRRHGAVGLLNTDWGDFGHRNFLGVSLHGYAHGAAHSWNGAAVMESVFTRIFTFHTFGDTDGRLADSLQLLGTADQESLLYHALVEPLQLPSNRFIARFNPPSIVSHYPASFPEAISKVQGEVATVRWPTAPRGLPEFEKQALKEFRIASRMNTLAWRRARMGQRIRAGQRVPGSQLGRWADEMKELASDFAAQWRVGNRPSRLQDNLKMMAMAAQECRSLR